MSDRTNTPEDYRFYGIQPVLEVRDVVATAEWYRDVLGFTIDLIDLSAGGHARVSGGGQGKRVRLRFTSRLWRGPEPAIAGYTYIHCVHIDDLYRHYRAQGVEMLPEYAAGPITQPWGLRDFHIKDCNGHVLCFAQEPG